MNPQAALDAPRFKVNAGRSIDLEASAPRELRDGLIAIGHNLESIPDSYMDFGAGQVICKSTPATSPHRTRGAMARPPGSDRGAPGYCDDRA